MHRRKPDNRRRAFTSGMLAMLGAGALPRMAWGQEGFPSRPIKVVVPFTPGSASDAASRFFGEKMSQTLGQAVIVENKPGAGGTIAAQLVKAAPADGYTILLGNISLMTVNPVLMKNPGYDPLADFKPLSGLVVTHGALVVPNESPYRTVAELMEASRKRPLNFGTFSPAYSLAAAYLANMADAKLENIPYKGQSPLTTDLIGNQLDAAFFDVSGMLSTLQSGRVRVLAVTGRNRNVGLPDIPTLNELGFKGYAHESWVGFFTHIGTPDAAAGKLTAVLQDSLKTPEAAEYARQTAVELFPYPPNQLKDFVASEIARFRRIADQAGMEAT